eukprot:344515-Rhodomonas_salina.1
MRMGGCRPPRPKKENSPNRIQQSSIGIICSGKGTTCPRCRQKPGKESRPATSGGARACG